MAKVFYSLRKLLAAVCVIKPTIPWSCRGDNFKHVASHVHSPPSVVTCDIEDEFYGAILTPDFACAVLELDWRWFLGRHERAAQKYIPLYTA